MRADRPLPAPLPADDRAFLYGDSVFETMLAARGQVLWWSLHRDRLAEGARRLSIPMNDASIAETLADLPGTGLHTLRLTLSRGSGPRGYDPTACAEPRLRLWLSPFERDPRVLLPPATLVFSSVTMAEQPLLAGIKHGNRLEQVLAAAELARCGADEALLLSGEGAVQCAVAANIFAVRGTTLYTPPCDRAGVAGTRRRLVIETLAPQAGLAVVEKRLSPEDCLRADALLLTSALVGLRPVARLDTRRFDLPHPAFAELAAAYLAELDAWLRD